MPCADYMKPFLMGMLVAVEVRCQTSPAWPVCTLSESFKPEDGDEALALFSL